jgi:ribosomal protein L37E
LFQCPHCPKVVKGESNLKTHIRSGRCGRDSH